MDDIGIIFGAIATYVVVTATTGAYMGARLAGPWGAAAGVILGPFTIPAVASLVSAASDRIRPG